MSDTGTLKYRAFISYSHADTGWARWLHRALESFRIDKDLAGRETPAGTIPETLRPIFRDRDDFTAGKALSEQTLAALDSSHALIVVCSPASAKSAYVNEETQLFKSRHPERLVIPLIVDGKPGDPERECFPAALRSKVGADGQITTEPEELLAADAREEGDGKDLALAKVIAALLGLSSDEVYRRAERERRAAARRKRRVQTLVGALALLLIAAGVAWFNQDYLREQYYWRFEMGPDVLTKAGERALNPGDDFEECRKGCPNLVVIPAGKFVMGSPEIQGEANERPQHEVTIAKPFAASKLEITLTDWQACVEAGACPPNADYSEFPATDVTWHEAKGYVDWLSRLTGARYRLLSEAEWEYAVRAGSDAVYSFGDDGNELGKHARYDAKDVALVQQRRPNAFHLYDMHGNAAEWVEDCYYADYKDAPQDGSAWTRPFCGFRVVRGGSWRDPAERLRSASRWFAKADEAYDYIGFRIARDLKQ